MGNFFKKAFNPVKNNAWTRAQKGISTGKKAVMGEDSSDAARSEAAENQDPNKNRSRQGGSAQIDYYGTESATT